MPHVPLLFPFLIEVARIDTATIAADPDASGPLLSGYDQVYREPLKLPTSTEDDTGLTTRAEFPVVQVPAQIEGEQFEKLQMLLSGTSPAGLFRCVVHFRDLERLDLVKSNGVAAFNQGDRLVRVLQKPSMTLVQEFPNPPGLYLEHALPRGWGLSRTNAKRNLLFLDFRARDQSSR